MEIKRKASNFLKSTLAGLLALSMLLTFMPTIAYANEGYGTHVYTQDDLGGGGGTFTHTYDRPQGPETPAPTPPTESKPNEKHYRIVKSYEEKDLSTGVITHIITTERKNTIPRIIIENEDGYKLVEWKSSVTNLPVNNATPWNDDIKGVNPAQKTGMNTGKVDIKDAANPTKETTLYIRLSKETNGGDITLTGGLTITESQVTI